ncbi:MAG TPA: HAD-IIIA family hydrolase [Chitinophagales bacterium]|nr:HAD-IIIA family hydrolase [Chitinophagales bacterium]
MTKTAIILAGGFGTRLQSVVKDIPKPMAPIAGKPFLEYLLHYLSKHGIEKVILSVGYKWETIKNYFGDSYREMKLEYSIEDEPLGTGGAILKAVRSSDEKQFFIFNGDSFFNIDLKEFDLRHKTKDVRLSLALKRMRNFDRYGVVQTDSSNRIIAFEEKKFYDEGDINGGIYILHRDLFSGMNLPEKFSFEKDVMEKYCKEFFFSGFTFDDYFIDIGIPEDYRRAQIELPDLLASHHSPITSSPDLIGIHHSPFTIDKSWTLFLDRDGVINKKIDGDYVRNPDQFEWLDGVQQSLVQLSKIFGRIIIVSNQQGVGKGLMTMEDVETIHHNIIKAIHDFGGRIDGIYFAPQLKTENSPMRKPGIGMALQAQKDFPDINFSKSIMIGDSMSDMEFAKNAGMKTVFISHGKQTVRNEMIDFMSDNLKSFSEEILNLKS